MRIANILWMAPLLTGCAAFERFPAASYFPLESSGERHYKNLENTRGELATHQDPTDSSRWELRFKTKTDWHLAISTSPQGILFHYIGGGKDEGALSEGLILVPAEITPGKPWHAEGAYFPKGLIKIDGAPNDIDISSGGWRLIARQVSVVVSAEGTEISYTFWLARGMGIVLFEGPDGPLVDRWELIRSR